MGNNQINYAILFGGKVVSDKNDYKKLIIIIIIVSSLKFKIIEVRIFLSFCKKMEN